MSNAIRLEKLRRKMKADFETFFKVTAPDRYKTGYIYGKHTLELIQICQEAFDNYRKGISTNIIVNIPARHGKSDIISRRLPVWVLLNMPNLQVMVGCATGDLAKEMSYDSRKCFENYCAMYNTKNEKDFNTATSWKTIQGGGMLSSGVGGHVAGKGADICIIDDYLGSREDADSEVKRNKLWNAFNDDFMLRLAPVHIVFIVATRWHEDDLVGRILEKNNPESDSYDSKYQKFKLIKYPAQNEDGTYLFPERFSVSFYEERKASLAEYGWNCMAQQDPRPRVGNILKAERVKVVEKIKMLKDMEWHLGVDLAHSDDGKGDPDYTVITLACFFERVIYVKSVWRFRSSALERDRKLYNIVGTTNNDKDISDIDLIIEQVGAGKDAFMYIRKELEDYIMVRRYINRVGKMGHASKLEPIFELGNVVIEKADWNMGWINELKAFPGGKHDDQMDSLFIAINRELKQNKYGNFLDNDKVIAHNNETEEESLERSNVGRDQEDFF